MTKDVINIRRKSFDAEAIRVTPLNINEVAKWCNGKVMHNGDKEGNFSRDYIKVRVAFPINEKQTQAHVGDWVVKQRRTFKVYNDKACRGTFELRDGKILGYTDEQIKKPSGPNPGDMPKKAPIMADIELVKDNEHNKAILAARAEADLHVPHTDVLEENVAVAPPADSTIGGNTLEEHQALATEEEDISEAEEPKSITLDELNDRPDDYTPTPGELYRGEA